MPQIIFAGINSSVMSRTRLTTPSPVSPSPPVLRPPVSHRGVHRSLFHSLQAVHDAAQPGLAPQSRRYRRSLPAQLFSPGAMWMRETRLQAALAGVADEMKGSKQIF